MAKSPSDIGYEKIARTFKAGVEPNTACMMFDLKPDSLRNYAAVFKSVRDGVYSPSIDNHVPFAKKCAEVLETIVPENPAKIKVPEPVKSVAEEPKSVAKPVDNGALALTRILQEIHSVDEHLLQLMDADLPNMTDHLRESNSCVSGAVDDYGVQICNWLSRISEYLKSINESGGTIAKYCKSMEAKQHLVECETQVLDAVKKACGKATERQLQDSITKIGYNMTEFTTAVNWLVSTGKLIRKATGNGSKIITYELRG